MRKEKGMGSGFNHIIAIYGHEMAFLPQRCPSAMPASSSGPHTPPRLLHPGLDSAAEIPQLVRVQNCGSAIHHNFLGINREKKKLHDYFPWFKWWLLFKRPELLLNTITIRREKLSRRKWKWKPSTVLLGGLNWKKNCFYKGCLLYVLHQCICFGYSMSLQFHSLNACMHLLPVSVTTSWIGLLQCHTHANQSFLWPKMLHWTSHRAAHFTEWLNSNMINHFYQLLLPWKKAQLQRTAVG